LSLIACDLARAWRCTYCLFPRRRWHVLNSPLPSARPVPRKYRRQGNYKGNTKETRLQSLYSSSAEPMKERVGRKSSCSTFPTPSSPASRLLSSSLSLRLRSSHSDASLCISSSTGTSLRTSVVVRKPSTTWLYRQSARRSHILNRPFPLPVSFRTSTHRVFCWAFHSGQFLKMCFPVCVPYRYH
jgi:hypothetical protein